MVDRVACIECGALILPSTAEVTGGRCMPCKNGIRDQIEEGKRYNKLRKEYDPFREHWISLVNRVHNTESGFDGLTDDEKMYFAVGLVDLDVTNGGSHQYFSNSAGEYYPHAVSGLERLGANTTLDLLRRAKSILFGAQPVPPDSESRCQAMKQYPDNLTGDIPDWCTQLDVVDNLLWGDSDELNELLLQFAETTGMIKPFLKPTSPPENADKSGSRGHC